MGAEGRCRSERWEVGGGGGGGGRVREVERDRERPCQYLMAYIITQI